MCGYLQQALPDLAWRRLAGRLSMTFLLPLMALLPLAGLSPAVAEQISAAQPGAVSVPAAPQPISTGMLAAADAAGLPVAGNLAEQPAGLSPAGTMSQAGQDPAREDRVLPGAREIPARMEPAEPGQGHGWGRGHGHGHSEWRRLYRCLGQLSGEQQARARAIVDDSLPVLEDLDDRIEDKMAELQALTYSDGVDSDALPRLGMDLQLLRQELRKTLMQVNVRLQKEVGVQMRDPEGRGCRAMRGAYQVHEMP